MLYLRKRRLETIDDIRASLLGAIRLEIATLPPYLTALYSIRPGSNAEVAKILRHVALQEMLHCCLACNLLNAVGGEPASPPPVSLRVIPGRCRWTSARSRADRSSCR